MNDSLRLLLPLALVVTACASGPRPMPAGVSGTERLRLSEEALLSAKDVTMSWEAEAKGSLVASVKGELVLAGGNALRLTADGTVRGVPLHLELDSRTGELNRSLSGGATVSGHHEPLPAKLGEAVLLKLSRMGLLHDVVKLSNDQLPDSVEGGVSQFVKAVQVHDLAPSTSGGQPCHVVSWVDEVGGQSAAEAEACIGDATSLPLERRMTAHFPAGDMTVTEKYSWKGATLPAAPAAAPASTPAK